MKSEMKFKIGPGGLIETIYDDGLEELAKDMGADLSQVCRASSVEWEDAGQEKKGWTVRAAYDSELAARLLIDCAAKVVPSRTGELIYFTTRAAALEWEVEHFWQLLPPKEKP